MKENYKTFTSTPQEISENSQHDKGNKGDL